MNYVFVGNESDNGSLEHTTIERAKPFNECIDTPNFKRNPFAKPFDEDMPILKNINSNYRN